MNHHTSLLDAAIQGGILGGLMTVVTMALRSLSKQFGGKGKKD